MWKGTDIENHRNCLTPTTTQLFNHKQEYPAHHCKTACVGVAHFTLNQHIRILIRIKMDIRLWTRYI